MNEKNLKKLSNMMKVMEGDAVQREELLKTLEIVFNSIDVLKDQIRADIDGKHENMHMKLERMSTLIKDVEKKANNNTDKVKDSLIKDIKEAIVSLKEEIDSLRSEIPQIPDTSHLDGKIAQVKTLIPSIEELENKLPMLGVQIRDGLELLLGDERLDKSAIKGIEDIENDVADLKKNKGNKTIYAGIGGSSSGGRNVQAYDLSSQLNGVLKTFTIPAFWRVISVHATSFPFVLRPTVDYTTSGSTITFTSEITADTTLAAGQTIIIIYAE